MPRSRDKKTHETTEVSQAFELPETFTAEKRERLFQEILHMYDRADEVKASTMVSDPYHRERLTAIATPYLTQIRCSADILITFYNEVAFNGRPITTDLKDTFEAALRNTFLAMKDFLSAVEQRLPPADIDPRAARVIERVSVELPELEEAPQDSVGTE
jgi:hypothetical protein